MLAKTDLDVVKFDSKLGNTEGLIDLLVDGILLKSFLHNIK